MLRLPLQVLSKNLKSDVHKRGKVSAPDEKTIKYSGSGRSQENIAFIHACVVEELEIRCSQEVGLREKRTRRILRKNVTTQT